MAESQALRDLIRLASSGEAALTNKLAELVCELCSAQAAGIFFSDESKTAWTKANVFPFSALLGHSWRDFLHEIKVQPGQGPQVIQVPEGRNVHSRGEGQIPNEVPVLLFPLSRKNRRHGILWAVGHPDHPLDAEDIRLITLLGEACFDLLHREHDEASPAFESLETPAPMETMLSDGERLQEISASGIVSMAFFDFSGRITEANDAFLEMVGYSREELQAGDLYWERLTPPEWMPRTQRALNELKSRGRCTPYEKEYLRRDGTRFWGLFNGAVVQGGNTGLAFILDVTQRRQAEQAAQESAAMLERAQRIGGMGHWVLHLATHEIAWSQQARQIFVGDALFDLSYTNVARLVHRDDLPRVLEQIRSAVENLERFEAEARIRRPDGSSRVVYLEADLDFDSNVMPVRLVGVVHDITERRLAEKALQQAHDELELRVQERTRELALTNDALRESTQAISALLQASPLAIIVLDPQGQVKSWNPAAEKMFGWQEAEVLGRTLPTLPNYVSEYEQMQLDNALQGGSLFGFETKRKRRDGTHFDVAIWAAPVQDAHGARSSVITVIADISDRKHAERERELLHQELEAERARLQAVLNQMPSGVLISEAPSERHLLHNEEARRLLGDRLLDYRRDEGIGAWEIMDADGTPLETEQFPMVRALHGEVLHQQELLYRRRDKTLLTLSVNAAPIRDLQGNTVAGVCVFHDISERKQNEQARTQLLRRIVTAQEDERRRIARELHDQMGQQLTALLLGLKALEGLNDDRGRFQQKLQQLRELGDRMGREAHDLALQLRPTALDDLGLQAALAQYVETWAHRAGIEADLHYAGLENGRLPPEMETAVYRIVQEALTNIAKHAKANRVSVILERRNEQLLVIVEDNGVGFNSEQEKHARQVQRRLGLLGMQERLAAVGGDLEIESSPGRGTTIFARVPLSRKEEC
jgi:PAS domain S-box-containing protein